MPYKDPAKAKANLKERKAKYLRKKKIEKFGEEFVDTDMRGWKLRPLNGSENPRWNKGKLITSHGYILRRVPKDHPLSFGNGYAYEHLMVWVEHGNLKPPPGYNIHHKDGNKKNNNIKNLELIKSTQHISRHTKGRGQLWQVALDVLREGNMPMVKWGDTALLHEIANRSNMRTKRMGQKTEQNVLAVLRQNPGDLIVKKQLIKGRWCNIFIDPRHRRQGGP